ncbi:hypothetical protein [Microcoleus sp. B9-D4]|uniref:hypothetical protein n=1 Tax=Microcoleus sp. B9-D4 TaxID=2818711 RepID=UPI002FD08E8D
MVSFQLSLFDVTAATKPIYKVGDRVTLRKKPAAASYVKKGDIVEVAAVHPNGSFKFWNERSERWEFVYPYEVGRVDSVSPTPTIADTEYTLEVADTEYTLEVADTEYTLEVADTEYTLEVVKDDSVSKAISIYRPRGTARSGEYFRFSYRESSRMRHIHIRGGNTDSPISQAKVQEVRSLLAIGIPPAQIAEMLRKPN